MSQGETILRGLRGQSATVTANQLSAYIKGRRVVALRQPHLFFSAAAVNLSQKCFEFSPQYVRVPDRTFPDYVRLPAFSRKLQYLSQA